MNNTSHTIPIIHTCPLELEVDRSDYNYTIRSAIYSEQVIFIHCFVDIKGKLPPSVKGFRGQRNKGIISKYKYFVATNLAQRFKAITSLLQHTLKLFGIHRSFTSFIYFITQNNWPYINRYTYRQMNYIYLFKLILAVDIPHHQQWILVATRISHTMAFSILDILSGIWENIQLTLSTYASKIKSALFTRTIGKKSRT